MKVIQNIKKALGKRKIIRILQSSQRKVKIVNYANAKSIGIVYPVSTTDYQDFINKFVDYLREEIGFKSIISIGYCNSKEVPSFVANESVKYKYFTDSHLDLYNCGNSKEVNDFIKEDFEILIDFSRGFVIPIKHIVASSQSGLKIGRHSSENEKYFDFMVEMDTAAPVSQFIDQINVFLKQVNIK